MSHYRIEDGIKIYMSVWESWDDGAREIAIDVLEWLEFYIWNCDGEFSENLYNKVVEDLVDLVNPRKCIEYFETERGYMIDYIKKNYPFNIKSR